MSMEIGKKNHPSSSMPLLSRLDHLELIMKRLEGRQNLSRWGGGGGSNSDQRPERQCQPLDLAMREAYFKGSLLDRVASLEGRLFQLCLELESSNTSCNSIGTSGDASSSQGSKKEVTLPTFNQPYQALNKEPQPILVTNPDTQGNGDKTQQKKKHSSASRKNGKNKASKDETKSCKSGKKRVNPSWPHMKLLGC